MTRPETRRALFRHHLYLPPLEKVRVTFLVHQTSPPDVYAQFECLTCGCSLHYDHVNDYWVCMECEYELTPGEARDLHNVMIRALDNLYPRTNRSLLWDLLQWWRRRQVRKPPRLPSAPV